MFNAKIFSAFAIFLSISAQAELFRSSYLSFELPSKWKCELEGTEHVCSSSTQPGKKEAVIVLTAKERGPSDSLAAYEQHLKTPRMIPDDKGKATQSKIVHVKRSFINSHEWVDGFHESSEIANYYTRYLATTKENLGILVTFSAHKKIYSRFSGDFAKAIQSLKVLSVPSVNVNVSANSAPTYNPLGSSQPVVIDDISPTEPEPTAQSGGGSTTLLGLVILVIAVLAYFLLRKKNNRPRNYR